MTLRRMATRPLHVLFLLILIAAGSAPFLTSHTSGQSSISISGAQVIAQGLTAPPAEKSAWRVVEQEIPNRIDAVPSVRLQASAGFLLSSGVDVFVVDQRTKLRSSLAPGEGLFVQTGANQTWASLDNKAGSAYTLELVDRDVADIAPTGEVIYRSGSFTTRSGDYDLDLVSGQLNAGDKSTITGGSYTTLVLATEGAITITSSEEDDPVRLKAGGAVALKGDLTVKSRGDDPATFVAAVLGDPVTGGTDVPTAVPTEKPTKAPTKEATEEPEATKKPKVTATPKPEETADVPGIDDGSSIRIAVRLCRAGMTYFAIDPRGCARADGDFKISLLTPDGDTLSQKDASKNEAAFVRWSGLEEGTYVLVVNALPDGYLSYSLDGFICCSTNDGYSIKLDKDQLVDGTLYVFQSDWGVGAPPAPTAVPTTATDNSQQSPIPGVDTDGDGLSDELEVNTFGTSPYIVDSDGDTISDGTEAFGLNGYLTAPALPDTDGDGVNDNIEIQNGTDPLDPSSS